MLRSLTAADPSSAGASPSRADAAAARRAHEIRAADGVPGPVDTLHLLMCYVMGLASAHPEFDGVERIGIFNPRLNREWQIDVSAIPDDVIRDVALDVIGYVTDPRG